MLTDLIIKNFAIIENLHVEFSAGFNVLTGETGAGKSIIIDAVNLLLGGRARGEIIRTGAEEASVEAIFDLSGEDSTRTRLHAEGLVDDDELLMRRTIARNGKNRIFINGSPVTLTQLRGLSSGLMNIYGQHEHQNLQQVSVHLQLLDHFGSLKSELQRYQDVFAGYQSIARRLENLDLAEKQQRQRVDMLSHQQRELEQAQLQIGEDENLARERSLLVHAEKLLNVSAGGYEALYAGQQAVCGAVAELAAQLEDLRSVDPVLAPLADGLRNHQYGLEDIASELRNYSEQLEFEPERRGQVEDRLALLAELKRKYAPTIAEVLQYLSTISQELEELSDSEGQRERLRQQLVLTQKQLSQAGQQLSEKRQQAALELKVRVEQELAQLAMPQARFAIRLQRLLQPEMNGMEKGEFFLTANPGEDEQPLVKIASGGELSRIMLALKRCVPEGDGVNTLIFDEVDAGIGGEAATAVGEKMRRLAQGRQVLCVTHLPQVAAFADQHYRVSKIVREGRTSTRLERLEPDARVTEVARMLGGAHAGQQALEHARELISRSCA